jgi:hypothetical protein
VKKRRSHEVQPEEPFVGDRGFASHTAPVIPLLRALGEVVYFAKMADGTIKIGHTTDLARRRLTWGQPGQLLAFRFGTYDDEQEIHRRLSAHVARGREWYHPTDEVMAEVESARADMLELAG